MAGCAGPGEIYQFSIAAAAVKRPDYVRPLRPIDTSRATVPVAVLQHEPTIDNSLFTWVALPDELRSLCSGRPDPLLALQQALGLPPERRNDMHVLVFDARPADMFRPCASSPDITTGQCSVDLAAAKPATSEAEHFVLQHMMASYRSGFPGPGYPFTAMGWTYDWDPNSPTHQGVSEYVVRPGAMISNVISREPAAFCQAHAG
ncbi:MAG: hypothetical protein WDN04_19730 [Rhodospirillales bacterium]